VEPAFNEAANADPDIYERFRAKHHHSAPGVVGDVQTIASIWRQENQKQECDGDRPAWRELYDKFAVPRRPHGTRPKANRHGIFEDALQAQQGRGTFAPGGGAKHAVQERQLSLPCSKAQTPILLTVLILFAILLTHLQVLHQPESPLIHFASSFQDAFCLGCSPGRMRHISLSPASIRDEKIDLSGDWRHRLASGSQEMILTLSVPGSVISRAKRNVLPTSSWGP
jgi:hypothetical protein